MPLDPVIQARVDAARARLKGGDQDISSDELATLKAKLASRKGIGGFSQNAAEIEARIAELEGTEE